MRTWTIFVASSTSIGKHATFVRDLYGLSDFTLYRKKSAFSIVFHAGPSCNAHFMRALEKVEHLMAQQQGISSP